MLDTMIQTERLKLITHIFTPTISPKGFDFRLKLVLNKRFKVQENSKHFKFMFKKKQSSESSEVINKNDIEFITKSRSNKSRAPNITVNKL